MLASNVTLGVRFGSTLRGLVRARSWNPSVSPRAVGGLLVFAGYYLGARLGLALTFQPHPVAVMWPPNAILLAALLLTSPGTWWFVLLSAFPAHLLAELQGLVPLRMVLCWFVSNSFEALMGAACTRAVISSPPKFDD